MAGKIKRRLVKNLRRTVWSLGPVTHKRKVDFIIAGTQKGGTTSLYEYVNLHPDICMSGVKELHFFDAEKNFRTAPDYRKFHRYFRPKPHHRLLGEATPIYMYWPHAIERIHAYEPRMKLILVLRDPAERAFSQWRMQVRTGIREVSSFRESIQKELAALAADPSFRSRTLSYVARGRYARQIRSIHAYFPPEQVLVARSEDLLHTPQIVLDRICDFLGVDHMPVPGHISENAAPDKAHLDKADRARLIELLHDDIRDLESLLGWDCSAWLKP
ncbi:MAG: sulfotransferase domain-containing protein [Chromatiales bacterium]|nr:sulfotransferase domain-containing protein [Chromatiales bacterium]